MSTIIEFEKINKSFPGVKALDDVSFKIERGEVHALVGENGAGKSTLLKIFNGNYQKDSGKIFLEGKEVEITSPNVARALGISIIFQEFNLVPLLSVAENIYLGRQELDNAKRKFINWNALYKSAEELLKKIGYDINPRRLVNTLSVAEKQMVEIAKAFSHNARVILMDEPSATLTDNELQTLFRTIKSLKARDVTVIYISHRLEEIFEICDRVTVLRDGKVIDTSKVKETNVDEIIKKMVKREISDFFPKRDSQIGGEVLRVEKLSSNTGIRDISFSLFEGEILGIAGLVGAGRTETARAIFGVDYAAESDIFIRGKRVKIKSPGGAIKNGIAFLTEERKGEGLILEFSVRMNMTMTILKQLVKRFVINRKEEKEIVRETVESLSIKMTSDNQDVLNLSGGNQQKIVLGKWLNTKAGIYILDEPTRGIDIGAKQEVYQLMNEIVKNGSSIIFISSELPEILGMSDRVLVMRDGQICGELTGDGISAESVMQYAIRKEAANHD